MGTYRNKLLAASLAVCVSVGFSTPAHAWICTYWVNDPVMSSTINGQATATSAKFDVELATSSTIITNIFNRLIAATKVQTAQRSADASRNSVGIQKAMQAYASAVNQQSVAEEMVQAQREFGAESRIASACNATVVLGDVTRAISSVPEQARNWISSDRIPSAPGGAILPRQAVERRLSGHLQRYCSQDEVSAGLCASVGARATADVDANTLFDPTSSQEDVEAYINNLAGDPLDKPTANEAKTPAGVLRLATAMRTEAMRSPALASLAVLRTQQAGGSGAGLSSQSNVTVIQALDEIMQQYGGGPKYQQWDAEVSAADEYGVLRELVKLRALSMKLRSYQTQSMTRIGAMISALLAGEAAEQQ
ncbi:hypothetical protein AA14337_0772 [Acetobacter malorum DSM 14337]|uniref:Uncharacterized protein n=2 Tax=Acetobacter malorum TaxID=178901 RepID=A0ABQ0PPX5_9PROT|nr:hypothetical protein AD930_03670 [Acetobacter malorum]GBQ77282.1 hypothetical protein AA14337_0772 [Acetobacter malorum DSM 14337]